MCALNLISYAVMLTKNIIYFVNVDRKPHDMTFIIIQIVNNKNKMHTVKANNNNTIPIYIIFFIRRRLVYAILMQRVLEYRRLSNFFSIQNAVML